MYVCVCIYYACVCLCVYVCVHVYMHLCVYVYVHSLCPRKYQLLNRFIKSPAQGPQHFKYCVTIFKSQHPHSSSQLSVTLDSGTPTQTYMQQNTNVHKKKIQVLTVRCCLRNHHHYHHHHNQQQQETHNSLTGCVHSSKPP